MANSKIERAPRMRSVQFFVKNARADARPGRAVSALSASAMSFWYELLVIALGFRRVAEAFGRRCGSGQS
jgi:hypothetical protein